MIYLGADHGGFYLKEAIKQWLEGRGLQYKDLGASKYDPNDDYPEFAFAVAKAIKNDDKGILICRSATGMVIAANKIKNIRAAAVYDERMVRHARQHNDVNVIGLSGDWIEEDQAMGIIKTFLETDFGKEERHVRRIKQIME